MVGIAVILDQALEAGLGAFDGAGRAQEAGVVVQGQDQAVHFVHQLLGVGVGAQVADLDRLLHAAQQRVLPGHYHRHQFIADRAGTVVVLDRAADVDAARGDFDRHALDPAREHGDQARQAARLLDAREEDFLFEAVVVELDHFELQVFARAEVREHAGLAHAHAVGQQADGQAFEAVAACEFQRHVQDRCPCLLAFAHEFG